MVEIQSTYLGNLRVESIHIPSKTKLTTDAPVDNQGKGESFSPTDLVVTSLGNCMMTVMAIVANRHQIDLSGTKIIARKHMVNQPIRRIGRIEVQFQIPQTLSEKDQKMLERAAMSCPVHESLHPDVKLEIQFNWGEPL